MRRENSNGLPNYLTGSHYCSKQTQKLDVEMQTYSQEPVYSIGCPEEPSSWPAASSCALWQLYFVLNDGNVSHFLFEKSSGRSRVHEMKPDEMGRYNIKKPIVLTVRITARDCPIEPTNTACSNNLTLLLYIPFLIPLIQQP